MWQRYTFDDVRTIAHYLGVLLIFSSFAMLAPFIIGVLFGEWKPASRYLFSAGITLSIGALMCLARTSAGNLTRQQAIAVTGFAWILLSAVAAIPLALSDHYASYGDAMFDAVSALTTTDVSIVRGMDHLSNADNMWRFVMNVAGGLGLVVVALSFGLFGRVADSSLYSSEGRSEHVLPNVVETGRFIFKFTLGVISIATVLIGILLLISGMAPARAFLHASWLAMSGFMTAGLTPMSLSVTYYHNFAVECILMVLMIYGCINFTLHGTIARGRTSMFFKDIEVRTGIIWWTLMLVVFIAAMSSSQLANGISTLTRLGLFNFISAATTTGFITLNSNQMAIAFPSGGLLVLALVMAVGGGSGATNGGIKLRRVGIIGKSALETMKRAVSSDSARITTSYFHVGRHNLDEGEVKDAMTVFIFFALMYIIGALVGIAYGYDAVASIAESVAMASNSGITAGISAPDMPTSLKVIYTIEMWAGRLEFVTLLALAMKTFSSLSPIRFIQKYKGNSR